MSNNAKNCRGFASAAGNCKKILKNLKKMNTLKVKAAAVFAGVAAVSAIAVVSAVAFGSDSVTLSAVPRITADSAAVMTFMPPKEYDVQISVDGKVFRNGFRRS